MSERRWLWDAAADYLGQTTTAEPQRPRAPTRVYQYSPEQDLDRGEVTEPWFSPTDVWAPAAGSAVRRGATDVAEWLVPELLRTVSRMAPYLENAMKAIRGERFQPPRTALPTKPALPSYPVEAWPAGVNPEAITGDVTTDEQAEALKKLWNELVNRDRTPSGEQLSRIEAPEGGPSLRIPARQPMRETMRSEAEVDLAQVLEQLRLSKDLGARDEYGMFLEAIRNLLRDREQ